MPLSNPLPSAAQLGLVVHRLFLDLRVRGLSGELDPNEVADIADVAELIGLQFINRDEGYLRVIADGLRQLADKYPRAVYYTKPLDMTDEEVERTVGSAAAVS